MGQVVNSVTFGHRQILYSVFMRSNMDVGIDFPLSVVCGTRVRRRSEICARGHGALTVGVRMTLITLESLYKGVEESAHCMYCVEIKEYAS
jgi:hypothetical protein